MAASLNFEAKKAEKYEDLVSSRKVGRIFTSYKSVYITAAIIALKLGLEGRQIGKRHDFIKVSSLSGNESRVLRHIALVHTRDPKMLTQVDDVYSITDELANAGIDELFGLVNTGGDRLYSFVAHCKQNLWSPAVQ